MSAKTDLFKNISFWIFWPILKELHSQKRNILGKNPLPISLFTYYYLKIKFVPFLKSQPATIPCKRVSQQDKFLKVSPVWEWNCMISHNLQVPAEV